MTTREPLDKPCPACGQGIVATVVLDVSSSSEPILHNAGMAVKLDARVVGMRIEHDCVPKTPR